MRESEQERKSFAYGIKIAPDSRGLVLPWRIFTFQSGAIGKSTSLSHLNSVKPCPAQIGSMDPSMLHQNRCGHIQPIKTQSPLGGGEDGWVSEKALKTATIIQQNEYESHHQQITQHRLAAVPAARRMCVQSGFSELWGFYDFMNLQINSYKR